MDINISDILRTQQHNSHKGKKHVDISVKWCDEKNQCFNNKLLANLENLNKKSLQINKINLKQTCGRLKFHITQIGLHKLH